MEILRILAGPLIGAVIGYCTNYIAVKMLFKPYYPVKVFGKTLPFTPGIIPKRQPDLARAVGKAVGDRLFGEEEIKGILQSDGVKNIIISGITDSVEGLTKDSSVKETLLKIVNEDSYDIKKETLTDYATVRVVEAVKSMDLSGIIVKQGTAAIQQMGGMLAMFASESMVASIAKPITNKILEYVEGDGYGDIRNAVSGEITKIEDLDMGMVIGENTASKIGDAISALYDKMLGKKIADILEAFDVSGIVEEKIKAMDIKELEELILSVMKHELGMIVNLGALIGFILGLINILAL